jgi:hypothetical protein
VSEQDIERIKEQIGTWGRDDWHSFRDALNATVVTVAVVQREQQSQSKQLDRIEAAVERIAATLGAHGARITVLEAHTNDGRNWGLSAAAVGTAIASAVAYFFGSK